MNGPLSQIEISRENLLHNVRAFRDYLQPGVQIAAVIKGNAYGHGQTEITGILEDHVDFFQVDDLLELRLLRKNSQKTTVVLGYIASNELEEALLLDGELCVYDLQRLPLMEEIAIKHGITPKLHIKVDALLGRQGILVNELESFLRELRRFPHLQAKGIYSHFSNIEDSADLSHAQKQIKEFRQAVEIAHSAGFPDILTHLSSTSGVLEYEKNSGTNRLVRIGIGLYGLYPSESLQKSHENLALKPVLRWSTHIAQIKKVPANYPIGYGVSYVTNSESTIAIIPQGYSDGFDRGFSNNGEVLIQGTRCPVIGRIAMNMFAVDVSHLSEVFPEEEVVLLGAQKNQRITAEEMAAKLGTINYEIPTRVSPLLPRVVC